MLNILVYTVSPFLIYSGLWLLYYLTTRFKRDILVSTKYTQIQNGERVYYVFDDKMEQYVIERSYCMMDKEDCVKIWNRIKENRKATICGYGRFIPWLDIHPKITNIIF